MILAKRTEKHAVNMAEGSIYKRILYFTLPLIVGNLFQQLYNMVDTWVVGNFVSAAAFSAVGTVGPIINVLIGTFMGLSSGAGVVIAQYFGAADEENVSKSVHTGIALTIALTIAFTAIGVGFTPAFLRMMNTPEDVFPEAEAYLTIYFAGTVGLLFYNMGAAILQAVGDARRPFYFLVLTACINTVLDLLLVLKFNMGVEGVAYATIIAQLISAVLVMAVLLRTNDSIRLRPGKIRFHMAILGKIIFVGIPAALQMAITNFSNIFVQAYINHFGTACMGGWTAYAKVDQIVFMPMQCLGLAVTTFVAQNLGSGRIDRAREGVQVTMRLAVVSTAAVAAVVMLLARPLTLVFNSDPGVVEFGTLFLRMLTPCYLLCCSNQILSGALRGAGETRIPTIIMLLAFVVFRQIYLFVMANFISNTVIPIVLGYPAGWAVASLGAEIYYRRRGFGNSALIRK